FNAGYIAELRPLDLLLNKLIVDEQLDHITGFRTFILCGRWVITIDRDCKDAGRNERTAATDNSIRINGLDVGTLRDESAIDLNLLTIRKHCDGQSTAVGKSSGRSSAVNYFRADFRRYN